jgi:DNA modification methylase
MSEMLPGATWRITQGDARSVLATWPAASVQTVITSPPYWGLRSYGTAPQIWGGDAACTHDFYQVRHPNPTKHANPASYGKQSHLPADHAPRTMGSTCSACGAWRGELGSEPTIDQYVANLVTVFRAVHRVLAPSGTLWLNIGDSYSNAGRAGSRGSKRSAGKPGWTDGGALGDKQLLLIPARVALALQADGWILRNAIVWDKPNAMPDSVKDRLTTSYEMLYLFSKQTRYYYDAAAIAEPAQDGTRNARDVWRIATEAFPGTHFATMPTALVERCILAGTSAAGQCAACGRPWARVTEEGETLGRTSLNGQGNGALNKSGRFGTAQTWTRGWQPTCHCDAGDPVPQLAADPFTGSGTVGVVALRCGRSFAGAELNSEYVTMAEQRIIADAPLFNHANRAAVPVLAECAL